MAPGQSSNHRTTLWGGRGLTKSIHTRLHISRNTKQRTLHEVRRVFCDVATCSMGGPMQHQKIVSDFGPDLVDQPIRRLASTSSMCHHCGYDCLSSVRWSSLRSTWPTPVVPRHELVCQRAGQNPAIGYSCFCVGGDRAPPHDIGDVDLNVDRTMTGHVANMP